MGLLVADHEYTFWRNALAGIQQEVHDSTPEAGFWRWHQKDGAWAAVATWMGVNPRSGWGSLVPHLEPLVVLIGSWASHSTPKVRQWAHSKVASLRTVIDRESRRDEEQVVRYS